MTTATDLRCCADDVDHCHGTVVVHEAGVECTEPGCALPVAGHDWQLPCAEVGCPCGGEPGAAAGLGGGPRALPTAHAGRSTPRAAAGADAGVQAA